MNQPSGYLLYGNLAPRRYRGRRHEYVFYPSPWRDETSGRYYEKGYYDENGTHYDTVSFQEKGKYKDVLCRCPYCGKETILSLDNSGYTTSLQCPNCTGQMEIKSELDELLSDLEADLASSNRSNSGYSTLEEVEQKEAKKQKRKNAIAIILAIVLFFGVRNALVNKVKETVKPSQPQIQSIEVIDNQNTSQPFQHGVEIIEGQPVYLELNSDGYHVVNDIIRADKVLVWDEEYDSWYDSAADCYLWYNTDVTPSIWQYWYEGISSDYGDYGWMEYDKGNWYIEANEGQWVKLPAMYDTNNLWHISG